MEQWEVNAVEIVRRENEELKAEIERLVMTPCEGCVKKNAEIERLRGELERATAWRDGWESAHQAKVEALAMAEARIAALDKVRDAADLINTSVSFDSCDACGSCTTCALFGNLDKALAALEDRHE